MKKKICILLCVLIAVFAFSGCSGSNEEGKSTEQKDNNKAVSGFILNLFLAEESETYFKSWLSMSDYELNYELMAMSYTYQQYGIPAFHIESDSFRNMIRAWQSALEECGAYESHEEFEIDEEGLVVSTEVKFKERDAQLSFTFDEGSNNVESLDISAKYSTGEILSKAGMNTLLGMGTVFAVLIFLAFLIYSMKYISVVSDWFKKMFKKPAKVDVANTEKTDDVSLTDSVECTDDLELVAVITAAIAAQEGTSTDGFVVRSIRRRPSNNWI